jgi:fatty-acid peroxygenase
MNRPVVDSTVSQLVTGYAWLPDRWRHATGPLVRTRLMGRHAVALRGPEAVDFFYDERHIQRHTALPEPVVSTLFGHGAVHTRDGEAHRVRKAMFVSLLMDTGDVARLVDQVTASWDEAVESWTERRRVVLFDEASRAITRGVCRWAGIPVDKTATVAVARDLVAMVNGFATFGPRHWRARRARRRREAWLIGLINDIRDGSAIAPEGSAADVVARHRDATGEPLDPHTAAVELLNVLRPTVAICWFMAFAGHALHLWPEHREQLRQGDPAYAEAFVHELRRFYPFAPFVGGRAVTDLSWHGEPIPNGALVLLDLYGQNHDPQLWPDPYSFAPGRFIDQTIDRDMLVPQGGGDPRTGHRCPGEVITIALLKALTVRLAKLDYEVPEQNLTIPLHRIPTRPRDGLLIVKMDALRADKATTFTRPRTTHGQ